MTGTVVLVVLVLAVVGLLEISHRRHSTGLRAGLLGSPSAADDRDLARSKLDLLALGGRAEPFVHKPVTTTAGVADLRRVRLHTPHGRTVA